MNMATPAAQAAQSQTIIIKKVKKGGHAHHGGAWKVAYADFVTAMMAFFLLLWLLNATTEEQKQAISNYFAPEAPSYTQSGAGGVMGGTQLDAQGGATSSRGSGVVVPIPASDTTRDRTSTEIDRGGSGMAGEESPAAETETASVASDATPEEAAAEALAREMAQEAEDRRMMEVETALSGAIRETDGVGNLAGNMIVDRTEEGLRIQIIDREGLAMFPPGSSEMYEHTRQLLTALAGVLAAIPNRVAITGHTDSTPFANPDGYSNWELSADRANASRRVLMESGIGPTRFYRVAGRADRDPLYPETPDDPRNRRISIVVMTQAPGGALSGR